MRRLPTTNATIAENILYRCALILNVCSSSDLHHRLYAFEQMKYTHLTCAMCVDSHVSRTRRKRERKMSISLLMNCYLQLLHINESPKHTRYTYMPERSGLGAQPQNANTSDWCCCRCCVAAASLVAARNHELKKKREWLSARAPR